MKKKFIMLLAALSLALCCLPAAARADYDHFDDVSARAWYADAVNWAVLAGVTNGTSGREFSPDAVCTRGQLAAFLWRAAGRPAPSGANTAFADVPDGSYYAQAIRWAAETGCLAGTGGKAFSPDAPCTCAEAAAALWRAEGRPDPEAPGELTEGWPEGEERTAVEWAESRGMLSGDGAPAEPFDPAAGCTRALAVSLCYGASFRFVTTVDQFVRELASNRHICLAPGSYNVTEWILNAAEAEREANPCVQVGLVNDGLELKLVGLQHVSIYTPTHDPADTSVVAEPRYANVLSFVGCSDVTLRGLTLGHTPEQGYCTGGVVYLEDCGSVTLKDLDLYGCGTYGVSAFDVERLYADGVAIHDCSYGGLELRRVPDASFMDCSVKNCRQFDILTLVESSARFDRCVFEGNEWGEFFDFLSLSDSELRFDRCAFDERSFRAVTFHPAYGETIHVNP